MKIDVDILVLFLLVVAAFGCDWAPTYELVCDDEVVIVKNRDITWDNGSYYYSINGKHFRYIPKPGQTCVVRKID